MRYLSVCSGIEAATVAWHNLGWTPVGFSEIEPFPSAVLAHHYPNVPNFGDMTKHEQWPLQPGSIDLLVGGTPCQSFSVAGLRKGLHDPRGGLMLTYLEIARRLRPRWVVWENVPGVLSSNGGRDFGSFLGALGELRYGWAYRVIDAQYCRVDGRWPKAVPQRRRRVFVVGCDLERDPRGRERAAEVLALRTGLRWHLEESRKTRKAAPCNAEGGVGNGGWMPNNPGVVSSVCTKWSKGTGGPSGSEHFNLVAQPTVWPADCAGTLAQSASGTGSLGYSNQEIFSQHGANLIPQPVPIQDGREIQKAQNGIGVGDQGDPAYTLDTTGAQAVGQPVPYDLFQITAPVNRQNRKPGDPCHTLARDKAAHAAVVNMQGSKSNACVATDGTSFTLNAMHGHDVHAVAHAFYSTDGTHGVNQHPEVSPAVKVGSGLGIPSPPAVACCVAPTITAGNDPSRSPQSAEVTQQVAAVHAASMTVRRLTPRECERLQGFPDDYTLIPWRKKQAEDCPDGPRYKALGNSMAVNCMAWIGERIAAVDAQINERNET